jgi:hypothetical protein
MKPGVLRVCVNDVDLGIYRTERVKMRSVPDTGNHIGIRTGSDFPALVRVADELAIATSAQPDVVPRFGPISRNRKALTARGDELNWAIEPFCRKSNQTSSRRHRGFGTERPTNKGAHDFYFVRIRRKPLGSAVLQSIDKLARLMNRKLIIHPGARGREELDRIVVLRRSGVFDVDRHLGNIERSFDIADSWKLTNPCNPGGVSPARRSRHPV